MDISIRLVFLLLGLAVLSATIVSLVVFRFGDTARLAWRRLILSAVPSLLLLSLFYSLAWHMHESLGGWPSSIGERGFSPELLAHCGLATNYFTALLLATLFVWPVAFLVCWIVRRWRRAVIYLSVHVLAFALSIGLMLLAPAPFLYWWQD